MTYDESANLMTDGEFRGRIKVAALKYATYIQNEDVNTQGHSARYRWALACAQSPDAIATQIQPMVVMDGQVQVDGKDITDANLQTSCEAVINRMV